MNLSGKKTLVIGLGVEGLSTARYLNRHGAEITLCDEKNEGNIDPSVLSQAKQFTNYFRFGREYLKDINQFELIFRSPSVHPNLSELEVAERSGCVITSNIKLFFEEAPSKIIGVTGTKGKGTTASMIHEMMKVEGKRAFLGGNIGTPPLDFLDEITGSDWAVLELSSFQLIDLDKSPYIAVVLMVTSEHLDWHRDEIEYRTSKYNIVEHQSQKDFAVLNFDYPNSRSFANHTQGSIVYFSLKKESNPGVFYKDGRIWRWFRSSYEELIDREKILLRGDHNIENALAATATASIIGISKENIQKVLGEFKGLEHRLELVRELEEVAYYNDSFSTTPETAIAAIESFTEPTVLILGGSSKKSDFENLGKKIIEKENIKAVILIGEEAKRIKEAIIKAGEFKGKIIEGPKNMKEIVSSAVAEARSGDVILLSPACASFDMFKNYKERGNEFKQVVNGLTQSQISKKSISW